MAKMAMIVFDFEMMMSTKSRQLKEKSILCQVSKKKRKKFKSLIKLCGSSGDRYMFCNRSAATEKEEKEGKRRKENSQ